MRSARAWMGLIIVLCTSAAAAVDIGPSKVHAKAWIPPMTPYGTPDLDGVWVNNRATPLERPQALAGRPLLTDAEVIALQQRTDRLFKNGYSDFAAGDAVFLAAFANLETYRNPDATGDSLLSGDREFDNRTSLIVDPPDGRIPPLTAAAEQRQASIGVARAAARQRGQMRPQDLSSALRCITWGVPRLIVNPYTDHDQIIQSPGTSCSILKPTFASFRWMAGRTWDRTSVRGWETREADGRAMRWSSIRRTSLPKAISWAPRNTCISLNA